MGQRAFALRLGAQPKPETVRMSTTNARETTLLGGFPAPVRQMHSARALQRVAIPFTICCDSLQDVATKWACDNVDQKKLDALKVAPYCVDTKVDKDCRKASSATLSRASIFHTFVVSAIAVVFAAITV
jgi:hypothetical protein